MRISTAAELGVRGMVYLAKQYRNGPIPMATICREQELPRQYMLKIFAALSRAGFVRTSRGKGGGFVLAQPPSEISILDIMQAVEGPLSLNFCQSEPSQCHHDKDCLVRPLWDDLQDTAFKKLSEFRLDRAVANEADPLTS